MKLKTKKIEWDVLTILITSILLFAGHIAFAIW